MRSLAATFVLCSLVLAAAGLAGAATPPPPTKFWTVSRCERTLHVQGDGRVVTADGYGFFVGLGVCVGTGGSQACAWAADHRSRLYSQFRVFSRSRYIGGIVRSWTLTTRGGAGLVAIRRPRRTPIRRLAPADYFMSPASVRLVAPDTTPARFRSIVSPIVARLTQQQNTTDCTGT